MRHLTNLSFMTGIAVFVYFIFLITLEQDVFLFERIVPPANVKLEDWLESFKWWGTAGITASWASSLLWYVQGQWLFKVNDWRRANNRPVWVVMFFAPVVVVILGILFTEQAQEGAILAYIFYAVNWVICFYLATVFFSPSAFKYDPLGAKFLRRW